MNSTVYFDSHYQIFLRFILRPDLVGSGVLAAVARMVGTRLAADGSLTRRETQSQHHSLNTDNKDNYPGLAMADYTIKLYPETFQL